LAQGELIIIKERIDFLHGLQVARSNQQGRGISQAEELIDLVQVLIRQAASHPQLTNCQQEFSCRVALELFYYAPPSTAASPLQLFQAMQLLPCGLPFISF
jgi:hypothetical protein